MSWGLPGGAALAERLPVPDAWLRAGIARRVAKGADRLAHGPAASDAEFAAAMRVLPVAVEVEAANRQHYELPAAFFAEVLGPQRKYSACLYDHADASLAEAEDSALAATARHAGLADGQTILELGCGWGSLSLWLARRLPAARLVAVSNSASQRDFIEGEAAHLGLANLSVVTCDMNRFAPDRRFDRIVSVEMFEHMANWATLLERVRSWLEPDGRLFLHVFSHRATPYRFDDPASDWVARHFFSGGLMPSRGLIRQFASLFAVEEEWWWDGTHYARTASDWLANFDRRRAAIRPILRATYGDEARVWERRWRLFFLVTAGLWGHRRGQEWGIAHYRLAPVGHG